MSLKSRIENHIVLVVISACVTTGGTVFAISQYFNNQSLARAEESAEIEHSQLETRLASIERGLAKDSYLDIRQLLRTASDDTIISRDQGYFPIDRFYALREIKGWQYQHISEAQYEMSLSARKSNINFVSTETKVLQAHKLHLWRGNKTFHVQSNGLDQQWYPHILVQRLSLDDFDAISKVAGHEAKEQINSEQQRIVLDEKQVNQQLKQLSKVVRDDIIGTLFYFQINQTFLESIGNADIKSKLIKSQKLGNVLYAQFMTEISNTKVNKIPVSRFYLRYELILISTQQDIYLVKILVPSFEPAPRDKMASDINSWLSALKIAVN